jgi:hypothetical protein
MLLSAMLSRWRTARPLTLDDLVTGTLASLA